jgi:hypothetical protein
MAGLWSRKFDRKNGETRECKWCGETFHAKKPIWKCTKCVNAAQKIIETKKRAKYPKKDRYPFDNYTNEAGNRFCKIRTALSNAWKEYNKTGDKSVIVAHYDKQLKEIQDNGIMHWILDRRDVESKKQNNLIVKSMNMINKDLPDTRGWYEE